MGPTRGTTAHGTSKHSKAKPTKKRDKPGSIDSKNEQKEYKRYYKDYPNENIFGCKGRLIMGPDRKYFYMTLLLILVPAGVFLGAVIPDLVKNVHIGWIIIVPHCALTLLILASFLITAFMDPGIIPRRSPPPTSPNPFEAALPPPGKNISVANKNGVSVLYQMKYCDTCCLYRPVRAIHCGICNNCVDKFDHHCPWVGNCVGKRNYRFFLMFIFSVMVGITYVQAFSIVDMVTRYQKMPGDQRNFGKVLKNPASLILAVYCLAIQGFVGTLAVYHCKLIFNGVTTNESIKDIFKKKNPFSRGWLGNWIATCCPSYPPRYVKWRGKVMLLQPDIENGHDVV